jgi:imidazolonepropionase-like amidohydrolase
MKPSDQFQRVLTLMAVGGCLAALPATTVGQSAQTTVAFAHVNVIDGTGAALKLNQTVVTSAGRITALGDADRTPVPSGAHTIDGTGKYLIPGLWDLHVHTRYEGIDHLRLFIANGVTGIRDMGGPWEHFDVIKRWRREIAGGVRIGPRVIAAGALLDGVGSELSFATIVRTPDDGRAAVRRLKEAGADFVKVYDLIQRDTFLAMIDEAKSQGLPVLGHPPLAVGLRDASNAGLRTVEHLGRVMLAASSHEDDIVARMKAFTPADAPAIIADSRGFRDGFDRARARSLAALLRRNNTAVIPTLSTGWTARTETRKKNPQIADRLRFVPPAYKALWAGPGSDTDFDAVLDLARVLHEAGVELLAGTDVVKAQFIPGFSLHDELMLLVSVGLSPGEALEAATRKAARLVGLNDVGTVESGMRADLVLLDANPLESIANSRRINAVMTTGRLFDRKTLDQMLADIEREAAKWKGKPTGRF